MKKRILPLILSSACLLLAVSLAAANKPLVNISRIQIQPGLLTAKLVMESDGPLSVRNVSYSTDSPRTLVMDVNGAQTLQVPLIPPAEAEFIRDIQVRKLDEGNVRFFIELSERVPCRLVSDGGRTVLELAKVQRVQGAYPIDADTQAKLSGTSRAQVILQKIDYAQTGDSVSFKADLSGQPVAQVFALENPPRLVVDLFDTVLAAKADVRPVQNASAPVQRLRVAQFQTENPAITRLVFDLKDPGFYTLDSRSDGLVVSFKSPSAAKAADKPAAVEANSAVQVPVQPQLKIEQPQVDKVQASVSLPPAAKTTTSAAAFPTAVEPKAEPRIEPKAAVPAPRAEDKSDAPAPAAEKPQQKKASLIGPEKQTIAGGEQKFSGEVISLRFKDADLRDVVLFLADFAGLNVIFDSDVRGTVTCNLESVPWDQALEIVLRQNKMGKAIEGNVLRIAPISVLIKEEEDQRKLRESHELAGPVQVKTFALSYSKAKDVQALLRSKLSSQGEIIVDERTNTLLITEVKDKLDLIEKLISVVDTPTPQVSIEARIVEANSTSARNLGIQWGWKANMDSYYGNSTSLNFPNSVSIDGSSITTDSNNKLGGYAINLPASSYTSAVNFSVANAADTFRIDMALTALESQDQARTISQPKVVTQNNQQAEIIQGRQIPIQTTSNFTVTTRYINAALELRATPQITAEGTVIMTIEIQNNAADFSNEVDGIPSITTQSAKTTVMVPDGGTAIIGGIYRTETTVNKGSVPFLSQVPILGNLFKNNNSSKEQRELLIFITPRIVR